MVDKQFDTAINHARKHLNIIKDIVLLCESNRNPYTMDLREKILKVINKGLDENVQTVESLHPIDPRD